MPTTVACSLFVGCCCALGSLVCLVRSQAYDYGRDISRLVRRQDVSSPIVVGSLPRAANGSIPLRLEVRQMVADPYRWDLFILALSMFQYTDQNDPLSWYQIAGIHGVPFQSWNGVEAASGANQSGYCTHSSVLFPIWHRPYLALFEQQIFRFANAIAGMFPNVTQRRLYEQAASEIRLPYWDWSVRAPAGQTHLPDVFWSPIVTQNGPNGVQNIRNPLYSYQFHPLDENALIWNPMKQWNETKRGPETSVSLTAPPSNNEKVSAALLSKLPEIQQRLFILFSNYHDFNAVGNKAWAVSQGVAAVDSLESVHDIIHIYGGFKGHMTYVPLSSFDPLFWLHHVMTDRLVAMWQMLNPTAWMTPMPAGETSFTAVKGTMQSADSPLKPFFSSTDGTFWDSNAARSTEVFGYAYSDTDRSLVSDNYLRKSLIRKISQWYGSSSPIGLMSRTRTASSTPGGLGHGRKHIATGGRFGAKIRPDTRAFDVKDGRYTEWIANAHVNVEALDGAFEILFFLGDVPVEESDWGSAQSLVGSIGIMAMNRTTGSQSMISGAAPLTSALVKMVAAGKIENLSPAVVGPFLDKLLEFRVLGSDDKKVDPALVAGLYVGVSSSEVKIPRTDTRLPEWGPMVRRLDKWV